MFKKNKAGLVVIATFILAGLIIGVTGQVASAQSQSGWRGEYFNNTTLSGSPILVRVDKDINFDWGGGSPQWGVVNADAFSVRWTNTLYVTPGLYRFVMSTDDGGRLWINGQLVVDKWLEQQGGYHEVVIDLPTGVAQVQMEYYENQGGAKALLAFLRLDGGSGGAGPWNGEYFNNKNLTGPTAIVRNETDINFDWGTGSPAPGTVNADNFSARWSRSLDLTPGRYQFATTTDDGVRLWVNNQLVIDQWRDQPATTHRAEIDLNGGRIPVKMEYFDSTGGAKAQLSWTRVASVNQGGSPLPGPWRTEYFNNTTLSGSPVLVRDEAQPNSNWGYGSPAPGIVGSDFFSVRWTRTMEFIPGRYRFMVKSDDGIRLWVNNQMIVNRWYNQPAEPFYVEMDIAGGMIPVRMEYYEAQVLAEARLSWERIGNAGNTGGGMMASVNASSMNVRQGPGTGFAIITQLSRGQLVQLVGFRNADATWVKIGLSDGRQGWSHASLLQSSVPFSSLAIEGGSQPVPASGVMATVAGASYVNVRNGPGVGYNIITALANGIRVEMLGRNTSSTWAKIGLPAGGVGWMNANYLIKPVALSSLPVLN